MEKKSNEYGSIYTEMVENGVQIDNHYSDLYVPVNETTTKILNKYSYPVTTFVNQIDGKIWYDIPFCYTPFWEDKSK